MCRRQDDANYFIIAHTENVFNVASPSFGQHPKFQCLNFETGFEGFGCAFVFTRLG